MTAADNRARAAQDYGLLSSSAVMAAGTVVSRLTGFGRAAVIAAAIGLASTAADTFNIPNVIPNMIYILVGGGILNSVLVPALVRAIKNDADEGRAYSQRLFSLTITVLGAATLVSVIAAPLIMRAVVSPKFLEPSYSAFFDNMVMFARFCLPQIFFYGLYVLIGQMLNARGRFGPMMWSPISNNLIAIAVFGAYLVVFGVKPTNEAFSDTEIVLLGIGSTVGVAVQALILIPVLRRTGFSLRFRTDWRDHGLGDAVRLGLWTFGLVAVNQLAYLIVVKVSSGASVIGDGSGGGYTVYATAMLIMMVPHAIITVSLATALLPRLADLASDDDYEGVGERLTTALRTCLAVIIPICALLAALAFPLSALIFDYGSASGQTGALAATLILFTPGLVGFTVHYLVLRGFYALQDTKTPFFTQIWVSVAMIIAAVAIAIMSPDRERVTPLLAVGYSIAYLIGSSVGLLRLDQRIGRLGIPSLIAHIVRITIPATLAGGLAWLVWRGWSQLGLLDALPAPVWRIVELGLGGTIGVASFVGLAYAFRIGEVRQAIALVRAKIGGPPPAPAASAPAPVDPGDLLDDTAEHIVPAETGTMSMFRHLDPERTAEFVLDETMHGAPGLWEPTSFAAVDSRARHLDIDTQPELPVIPATPPTNGSPTRRLTDLIIGRYRLENLLNETAGIESWQAVDEVLRRPVFVHTVPTDHPQAEAFATAARAAATVADPRFLRVLDVGTDTVVYVVREWTPAHSLARLLAAGPLVPDQAAAIAREVADALSVAHAQGLSHRRLDPTLVFVTTEGTVKIAGLETEAALHGPHSLTDSPSSPVTEPGSVDAAAIGGVLYAGLTARWPWEPLGGLPAAPRVDGRIPSPRQVRPGVPRDLNVITDQSIGHAARHHATPLLTPGAVMAALLNTDVGNTHVGGYDPLPPMSAPAPLAPAVVPAAEPPRLETRDIPPPLPGISRRQSRRSSGLTRVVGVVGAALLLVGATLAGLQLLLNAFDSPTDDDRDEPVVTRTASETSSSPDALNTLEILASTDFDPLGNNEERSEDTGNVIDGDPSTDWKTVEYYSELTAQKEGVGVYLDLGEAVDIRSVNLSLLGEGTDAELRVAPESAVEPPSSPDEWIVVGTIRNGGESESVDLDEPVSSRYLLVWLTRLPAISDGVWQGGVVDVEVLG